MAKKEFQEVRREVPYLIDRVHSLACTYLSQDWLGVKCIKNKLFQIIPAPRSLSSTSESLIEKAWVDPQPLAHSKIQMTNWLE